MIHLVIAYKINENEKNNYNLWYLVFDQDLKLKDVKKTNKLNLISRLFQFEKNVRKESWYSWDQKIESPKKIEILDFISKGIYDEKSLA